MPFPDESSSRVLSLTVHEFRTPLTVVAGYLRMLRQERAGPLSDQQRKLVEEADKSCGRLSALIAELSDLANLNAGTATFNRGSVQLFALVEEAVADVRGASDPPPAIEIQGSSEDAVVDGDATRLRHAIAAICRAVLREAAREETLSVRCSVDEQRDARIAVGTAAAVSALTESASGDLEPFDEWRGGVGLSLPVARHVIEQHDGGAWSPAGTLSRSGALIVIPLRPAAA